MLLFVVLVLTLWTTHELLACTGITLKARDGAVVYGRTMEWGTFDLDSRVVIVPEDTGSPDILLTVSRE